MSIIAIDVARAHLRLEPDYPAQQVQPYLDAAEDAARQFLNRRIFADQAAKNAAVAAIDLAAAKQALDAAIEAAEALTDPVAKQAAVEYARYVYQQALSEADETFRGVLMNPQIQAGVLLIAAHLFERRGDAQAAIPEAAYMLLHPYRQGLGA